MSFALTTFNSSGTVTVTAGANAITGVGTSFLTQIGVGSVVVVAGQTRTISAIASATSATVSANWATGASAQVMTIGSVITQTGTDASLSGLSGIAGVTTITENASTPTPTVTYVLPAPIVRLDINGTLNIEPLYERLMFRGQPRSAGALHQVENNSKIIIGSAATVTIGSSSVATSVQEMLRGAVWLSSDSDWTTAGSNCVLILHRGGGRLNWNYGTARADVPMYRNESTSLGYFGYADLYGATEISRTGTQSNSILHISTAFEFINPRFFGVRIDTNTAALQMAGVNMLHSGSGIILRQVQVGVREHSRITTSSTNQAQFTGTVAGVEYQARNISSGTTGPALYVGTGNSMRIRHGVDFKITGGSGTQVIATDSEGTGYLTTMNASGVSTSETLVTTGRYNGSTLTRLSPTNDDTFSFQAWQYERLLGTASAVLQGLDNAVVTIGTLVDSSVTLSASAAAALTAVSTLDELYDLGKLWKTQNNLTNLRYPSATTQPITANGTELNLGSLNLIVDGTALDVFSINTSTNTITIKSTALAAGSKFRSINTTGSITVVNGGSISASYTDASGSRVTIKTSDNLSLSTYLTIDGAPQAWQTGQTARNIFVTPTSVVRIYAHAYGYRPRIVNVTGNNASEYIISLVPETFVDTTQANRDTIAAALGNGLDGSSRIYLSVNADLRQYTPAQVLHALHWHVLNNGSIIAAAAVAAGDLNGFELMRGGFIIRTPGFYGKVADSVTTVNNLGILVPLSIYVDPAVYIAVSTYTPVEKNTSDLVLQYAPWTQQEADVPAWVAKETSVQDVKTKTDRFTFNVSNHVAANVHQLQAGAINDIQSGLAKQESLVTINDGVKKASLLVPHNTDLT